jgi:hypothetical protein
MQKNVRDSQQHELRQLTKHSHRIESHLETVLSMLRSFQDHSIDPNREVKKRSREQMEHPSETSSSIDDQTSHYGSIANVSPSLRQNEIAAPVMASPDIPSNNMKLATVGDLLGPKKEYLSLNGVTIDTVLQDYYTFKLQCDENYAKTTRRDYIAMIGRVVDAATKLCSEVDLNILKDVPKEKDKETYHQKKRLWVEASGRIGNSFLQYLTVQEAHSSPKSLTKQSRFVTSLAKRLGKVNGKLERK